MSAIKKSVRIIESAQEVIDIFGVVDTDINWSGCINEIAKQFSIMANENEPALSDEEWIELKDFYLEHEPKHGSDHSIDTLILSAAKSDKNCPGLLATVNGWSNTQKIAAVYSIKRFIFETC